MKTDRELLELAAKAAGIGGGWDWPRGAKAPIYWRDASGKAWTPLHDDGDALRLAVKLMIDVGRGSKLHGFGRDGQQVLALGDGETFVAEGFTEDPLAATRRAIVRAAAAIGERA